MGAFNERDLFDGNAYEQEDAQKDKFLTFKIEDEEYGVEIRFVTEIIGIQKITKLPDMPDFIKGVINLRSRLIPVIDVRVRFKMDTIPYGERTCIIVVNILDASIGLIVDEVSEVIDIPDKDIDLPPRTSSKTHRQYIKGIGKVNDEVKIILDLDKLLSEEELQDVAQIAQ